MERPRIIRRSDGVLLVERFSPLRRVEHLLTIVTFVVLVFTGFPQKFYDTAWAAWVLHALGGLDNERIVHRIAGLVFAFHALLHVLVIVVGILTTRIRLTLLPTPQDLRDVLASMAYYLGYRGKPPAYPKFDYRQKFEYLGIVLGGMVMILSGLTLLYPGAVASFLPGQVIPAARIAHSNEALLALLVLVVWHMYGSHLSPEVFPMDKSIFTGYMTAEELRERHALEYARLFPEEAAEVLQETSWPATTSEKTEHSENKGTGDTGGAASLPTKDPIAG